MTEKNKIVENYNITLNGKPAKVFGRLLAFPKVASLDGTLSAEFAWETVAHVISTNKGQFKI